MYLVGHQLWIILPETGRKYNYKSRIGKHPNRTKRKLLSRKVYLYSNIHTEMQCGKVMAWNKICRLTVHSVANITPWCYLVSGFFLYPSFPKQTQNLRKLDLFSVVGWKGRGGTYSVGSDRCSLPSLSFRGWSIGKYEITADR